MTQKNSLIGKDRDVHRQTGLDRMIARPLKSGFPGGQEIWSPQEKSNLLTT